MTRRILTAILVATTLAVVVFGLPLALAVGHLYREEEVVRLERFATEASAQVPFDFATSGDPVELPPTRAGRTVALYAPSGRLVTGRGPATADRSVRRALEGRVAEHRQAGALVVAVPVAAREQVVGAVRVSGSSSLVTARVRRAWLVMGGVGLGALALAGAVAAVEARRLGRPVRALARAAARLGEGDFTARTAPTGIPEVDGVARTLDATAERLGELLARERAFSADASHQLRTPLAGLRLELEAALVEPERADPWAVIASAVEETERLDRTIDDLLSLARDVHAPRGPVDFARLLDDVDTTWRGELAEAGRPLRLRVEPDLPVVRASATAVRHVLDVLVSNAVRHGRGTVSVTVREAGGGVAVEVADEGPGVTGDPGEVFTRRTGSGEGHGIGLALARSLAETEGGRLVLRAPGPGPVFALLFPAEARHGSNGPPG